MMELELENILSWENFYIRYTKPIIQTGYPKLFDQDINTTYRKNEEVNDKLLEIHANVERTCEERTCEERTLTDVANDAEKVFVERPFGSLEERTLKEL